MSKILVTGFSGQDGYLMVSYLLRNTDNSIICGIRRVVRGEIDDPENLLSNDRLKLIDLDITDQINVERVIKEEKPDYFINFAANSFVGNSWDMPVNHFQTNCMAVLYQLEAIKKYAPNCRYYSAGTSEQFGDVEYSPQDIKHPLKPRSPYGAAKCAAHHLVKVYRESYNLYAVHGILFNHEGVRRGSEFVTRKITKEVVRIKEAIDLGDDFKPLELGNLSARRDWSDAEDVVDGVWRMLNQELVCQSRDLTIIPDDYVLASGETYSIQKFVEEAFKAAGIFGVWHGEGLYQKYLLSRDGFLATKKAIPLVVVNPDFYRPAEVELLCGDSAPAREILGWKPKTSFKQLVKKMVENDLNN